MSKITTTNLILVKDINCVAAITHKSNYRICGVYKDKIGDFWFSFEYSDDLQIAISNYENGNFMVTVPSYIEHLESLIAETDQYLGEFGNQQTDVTN